MVQKTTKTTFNTTCCITEGDSSFLTLDGTLGHPSSDWLSFWFSKQSNLPWVQIERENARALTLDSYVYSNS